MKSFSFRRIPSIAIAAVSSVFCDQRAVVAPLYAGMFLTMMAALGIGMDMSNGLQVKYQLDLAADAGSIACAETWQTYMQAGAGVTNNSTQFNTLLSNSNTFAATAGKNAFIAQAGLLGVIGPSAPSTSTPTILVSNSPSVAPTETAAQPNIVNCKVQYTAENLNYIMQIMGFKYLTVKGTSNTEVELAPYVNVYLVLDTSASMMVGSTPTDQGLVANYVLNNASSILNGDTSPCAFACHEEPNGTNFKVSDMQAGESNAHAAGATTRFDVMRLALVNDPSPPPNVTKPNCTPAAQATSTTKTVVCDSSLGEGLISYIRDKYEVTNARASLSTFTYSLYGFNEGINENYVTGGIFDQDVPDNSQYVVSNTKDLGNDAGSNGNPDGLAYGVNQLTIGLNTHLMPPVKLTGMSKDQNSVMQDLQTIVGTTKPGYSTAPGLTADNPLKFVILITDGMSSDRNWAWCNASEAASCNNDPIPTGTAHPVPSTTTPWSTICANWAGAAPTVDGVPIYYTGTTGAGECLNTAYEPGFWQALNHGPVAPTNGPSGAYGGTIAGNDPGGAPTQVKCNGNYYYVTVNSNFPRGFLGGNPCPYSTTSGWSWNGSGVGTGKNFSALYSSLYNSTTTNYESALDTDAHPSPYSAGGVSFCSNIKANGGIAGLGATHGVTIAVLETPYVPMTGQDPQSWPSQNYPYEGGVQQIIYPNGNPVTHPYVAASGTTPAQNAAYAPGPHGETMQALSQALYQCSTQTFDPSSGNPTGNYYFQATSNASVGTGFIQLFNTFAGQWVHINQ